MRGGNILAYNLRTGKLINSFIPGFNSQDIARAAPAGFGLYVTERSTVPNGPTVWRLLALNSGSRAPDRNSMPKPPASV